MILKGSPAISRLLFFLLMVYNQQPLSAAIKLPRLISNGMVLQREKPIKIWGWADVGEKVEVRFAGTDLVTQAGSDGKWQLLLPAMKAGGPKRMIIKGTNLITLEDILIGDVWLCGGQSNMELTMHTAKEIYQKEIANANNPSIRQFLVKQNYSFYQQQDLEPSSWKSANPQNVLEFSAVGYFFALEVYNKYRIPVGLINNAVGGTPAEAWMSDDALIKFPYLHQQAILFKDPIEIEKVKVKDNDRRKAWFDDLRAKDMGLGYNGNQWKSNSLDFTSWASFTVPGLWQKNILQNNGGVVWLKRIVTLSKSQSMKSGYLELGNIDEQDSTYINGVCIGVTSNKYQLRKYVLPNGLLKEGENIITVRVLDTESPGGFIAKKPYQLILEEEMLPLSGVWKYKVGVEVPPLRNSTFTNFSVKPTVWYNSKIAPILHYQFKGVLWYQGEANVHKAKEYSILFPALIKNWREKFGQGDFPFLFVQLANLGSPDSLPSDDSLTRLREAQAATLSVANTAMAVTHDIGEWDDIHPLNKKEVGRRLFLSAQKVAYGLTSAFVTGPIFKSFQRKGTKFIIHFDNVGSGLRSGNGKPLSHFAIAGEDGNFVWAEAEIQGKNIVVVHTENVKNAIHVRYAWSKNPQIANLYGENGLPAVSFRTDRF